VTVDDSMRFKTDHNDAMAPIRPGFRSSEARLHKRGVILESEDTQACCDKVFLGS